MVAQAKYKKMDPGLRAEWVYQLRRGDFTHGRTYMRVVPVSVRGMKVLNTNVGRFDPLGILTHIVNPNGWRLTKRNGICAHGQGEGALGARTSYPPRQVLIDSGLDPAAMRHIARMSDSESHRISSPYAIADWIEAEL